MLQSDRLLWMSPCPFFPSCPTGLFVELRRECGQSVGDEANPRLPALALHPIGQAVLPELRLVGEVRKHR